MNRGGRRIFWSRGLSARRMHVLDVRPGITDPASIKFRNENELMEKAEDSERLKLYLEYVEKHSFLGDIGLIFKTFWVIVKER